MRLKEWFVLRGTKYVRERGLNLLDRYDIAPARAKQRMEKCLALFTKHGCVPTFPTPGRIVQRYPKFIRHLRNAGAEIAVHGYDHLDLNTCSPAEAREQLEKAVRVFDLAGIQSHGFRCPYLSCSDELLNTMSDGLFDYSSNKAIRWDVGPSEAVDGSMAVFKRLASFYRAESSSVAVATPRMIGELVEIPASTPDDLQLLDGLKSGNEGLEQAWCEILRRTHRRGECFVLVFHPELFDQCALALDTVLSEAAALRPAVWSSHLAEVSKWWREKSRFAINVAADSFGTRIHFDCSDRATVLIRNLETSDPTHPWDNGYRVLESRLLNLAGGKLPLIGVSAAAPKTTLSFLREQGYLIDERSEPSNCELYLDESTAKLSEVELIEYIERSPAPLVRFWRWPGEAKSALCVTGDLDALSLIDYAARLFSQHKVNYPPKRTKETQW